MSNSPPQLDSLSRNESFHHWRHPDVRGTDIWCRCCSGDANITRSSLTVPEEATGLSKYQSPQACPVHRSTLVLTSQEYAELTSETERSAKHCLFRDVLYKSEVRGTSQPCFSLMHPTGPGRTRLEGRPYLLLETCGIGSITLDRLLILSPFSQACLLHFSFLPVLGSSKEGKVLDSANALADKTQTRAQRGLSWADALGLWKLTPQADYLRLF